MSIDPFESIPAPYRGGVRAAFQDTFGKLPAGPLQQVHGGASGALSFRADVDHRSYVLRLDSQRDFFRNPARSYACMQTASDAGLAPLLHYAEPGAGIAIMDYIPQQPHDRFPGGAGALAAALGELLQRLQATEPFPSVGDYLEIVRSMLGMIRNSDLFGPGLLDPHHEAFERLREVYPWRTADLVSSHNDPNPRNILFDGNRLWLVDWELSFRNDPLADVAIIADEFGRTGELEDLLLTHWLGAAPDPFTRARLTLMRQITRLYYAGIILSGFALTSHEKPDDLAAPTVEEFTAAITEGRMVAASAETFYTMGKMTLAGFLAGVRSPEVEEALRIVARG